ncbi:hypothetical protein [Nocardioides zeae]
MTSRTTTTGPRIEAADVPTWGPGVPRWVLVALPGLSVAAMFLVHGDDERRLTAAELLAPTYVLEGILVGVAMVAALGAWFAPRPALAATTTVFALHVVTGAVTGAVVDAVPELVAAVVGVAVLAVDALARARQRDAAVWTRARQHGRVLPVVRPLVSPPQRVGAALALLASAGSALIVHGAHERVAVLAERGVPGTGEVVTVDRDYDEVTVEHDGGRFTYLAWEDEADALAAGDEVPLLVDPRGRATPYPLGEADPDGDWVGALMLLGGSLALVLLLGGVPLARAARLRRLAASGAPGAAVRAFRTGRGMHVRTLGADGGLHLVDIPVVREVGWRDVPAPLVPWASGGRGRGLDVELVGLDDEHDDEHDGTPVWDGPPTLPLGPSRIHGLDADGALVLVTLADGTVLAGTRPVRR